MSIVHEKKYEAIDAFNLDHWEIEETPEGRHYTVKAGSAPQTVTITRPSGGTQTHNDMPPGSTVEVNRTAGTAVVTVS